MIAINEEHGLKSDWKDVEGVVSLLTKRQRRRDKTMVSDAKHEVSAMSYSCSNPSSSKPSHIPIEVED